MTLTCPPGLLLLSPYEIGPRRYMIGVMNALWL